MKLRTMLFAVLLLVAIVPTVLLVSFPHSSAYDKEIADVTERHLLLAQNIGMALERYEQDVKATFKTLVLNMLSRNPITDTQDFLSGLNFRHICIASVPDRLVVHTLNDKVAPCPGFVPPQRFLAFLEIASNDAVNFTPVLPGPDGTPLLYMVWRVGSKLAIGAVRTDYIVGLAQNVSFGEKGHAAIVDHTGRVLAHPLPEWRASMKDISKVPPVKRMLNQETGVTTFYSPALKDDMIAGYTWVKGAKWGVMIPQPVSELQVRAAESRQFAISVIFGGVVLAAILSWIMAGYLTRPVLMVADTARRFTSGDRTARVTVSKSLALRELNDLAGTFNALADSVGDAHRSLADIAESVSSASGEHSVSQLISGITKVLPVDYAYFGELVPDDPSRIRTVSFFADGEETQGFEYDLSGSPCANVVGARTCVFNETVQQEFPSDAGLKTLGVTSYIGMPVNDSSLKPIGLLVVMSRKPMENVSAIVDSMRIFTNRLASEWQHQQIDANLHAALDTARQANNSKSIFLANMSHELRTPLNAIIGFTSILAEETLGPHSDSKYAEYSKDVLRSSKHLLDVINDILDISMIEVGEIDIVEEETSIKEQAIICSTMIEERAIKRKIDLVQRVESDLPRLRADTRHIRQVLINLLTNAVKFTLGGGKVSIDAGLKDNNALFIEITDTGIGIAPEDIPLVLQPFGQARESQHLTHEGTGLGLSISRRLMELHGGTLSITSEVGKGTTVTLMFPPERTVNTLSIAETSNELD
jgi:signal transduction histidine kinase/HAMP domain-containing protein